MENYYHYTLGGARPKLRPNVKPHIFNCHPEHPYAASHTERPAFLKLNRKREISRILYEDNNKSFVNENMPPSDCESSVPKKINSIGESVINNDNKELCKSTTDNRASVTLCVLQIRVKQMFLN